MPPGWRTPCSTCILLAAARLAAVVAEQAYPHALQLSGACDSQNDLNSLIFEAEGTTASGAPFYKARGQEEYVYFDPDCSGGGDGNRRWILDSDRPSTTAEHDLDGDGACQYHARINWDQSTRPPFANTWRMNCDGEWKDRFLSFLEITSTSTATSTTTRTVTTRTSTSSTRTSSTRTSTITRTSTATATATTTATATATATSTETATATVTSTVTATTTEAPPATATVTVTDTHTETRTTTLTTTLQHSLVLSGVCEFKDFLNNMTFRKQGVTASGAPYYKSTHGDQYLYYDLDCNGGGNGKPRWVLDVDAPNASRTSDLDGDGGCNYHARLGSNITESPPSGLEWQVFCGTEWVGQVLMFVEEPQEPSKETSDGDDSGEHEHAGDGEEHSGNHSEGNGSSHGDEHAGDEEEHAGNHSEGNGSSHGDEHAGDGEEHAGNHSEGNGSSHGDEHAGDEEEHPGNHSEGHESDHEGHGGEHHGEHGEDPARETPSMFVLSGACAEKSYLDSLVFSLQGTTASGASFYKSTTLEQYIYWDPSCAPNSSARWIIDANAPNVTRESDLDADGACDYHARAISDDSASLPDNTTWRMYCGGVWKDVTLSFEAAPGSSASPSTSSSPASNASNTTHGEDHDAEGAISFSARAFSSSLLAWVSALLVLASSA